NAHLYKDPPFASTMVPDLPSAIDPVIMKALAKDPDDRYQTCRDFMAAAIEAFGWDPEHPPKADSVFSDEKHKETRQSPKAPEPAPAPVVVPIQAPPKGGTVPPPPPTPGAGAPLPPPPGDGQGTGGGWPPQSAPSRPGRWPLVAAVVAIA